LFIEEYMMAMLKSLETLALNAVPNQSMFQLLRDYYDAPFAQQHLPLFLERCSLEEMEALSRTIPWDHPLARKMDWTVHQRRLKGKTCLFVIPLSKNTYRTISYFVDRQTGHPSTI